MLIHTLHGVGYLPKCSVIISELVRRLHAMCYHISLSEPSHIHDCRVFQINNGNECSPLAEATLEFSEDSDTRSLIRNAGSYA